MKNPLPVTLDDLQATAKDDLDGKYDYRKLTVFWLKTDKSFLYKHDGFYCTEEFAKLKLAEYGKQSR